jgi:hypothetical protein
LNIQQYAIAYAAHQWTSHVPDERARQEIANYATQLTHDRTALEALATSPDRLKTLETEWTRYRTGFCRRYLVLLARKSRCASTMVTGAEIRRLEARLAHVARVQAEAPTEITNEASDIRVEIAPGDNRVRVFFPGKPDATVRTRLKSCGFRWTPSLGCWQAFDNPRARAVAATFTQP